MTQDAIVYKVSSCLFFCLVIVFVFDCSSAKIKLGLTPFTENPRCKLPFTENSRTYNSMLCVPFTEDHRTHYFMHAVVGPTIPCMLPFQ